MLTHDRQITISAAGSRKATSWPALTLSWSEMIGKLQTPARGTETFAEYMSFPKGRQDDLKDVGGYVAGTLSGPRRKAGNVVGRDVITLDMDNIPAGQTDEILRRLSGLGCAYVVYSTRKHCAGAPRLRILLVLDRTATADEYEPLARMMAQMIGMEFCDPTTFEASRLMYWPSCSADGEYVFRFEDKPFLYADGVLARYSNWRDITQWPEVPGAQQAHVRLAAKQGDPVAKVGVVGAFCKTYDIYRAIDTFLPGVYTATDDSTGRYTFVGGSTVGGAVIYDNGSFLFSHHATDPTSGRLVNAFDLVRMHRFADLDDESKLETPTNKLPSYVAMCALAVGDPAVAAIINAERIDAARDAFSAPAGTAAQETANWVQLLDLNPNTGRPERTIHNVRVILEHDPAVAGRIRLDRFSGTLVCFGPLPWDSRRTDAVSPWTDTDENGLRGYLERVLRFSSRDTVLAALSQTAEKQGYHPVRDYLMGLSWDGVLRLDTLLIDYLGTDDHPYTRAVTRKAFTAAVYRIMQPGVKYDTMTVIHGKQGIGKSTLIAKMSRGWFSDAVVSMEGKEGAELLQGVWLVEIGELSAYNRSGIADVRMFLSRTEDHYRAPYARTPEHRQRQCVFFGTTNDVEYLRDPAGNRRYWPISTQRQRVRKNIFRDLDDEIDQLWAEAVMRWRLGESLILPAELEAEAETRRETHTEQDTLFGIIENFINCPVPIDWPKWDATRRQMFWASPATYTATVGPRDRICSQEVWRECLGDGRAAASRADTLRINAVLDRMPGWEKLSTPRMFGPYGNQKGYFISENATTDRATFSKMKVVNGEKVADGITTMLL